MQGLLDQYVATGIASQFYVHAWITRKAEEVNEQ